MSVCVFFFFKQKTAYERRISAWSSDVCSSDLTATAVVDSWALGWTRHSIGQLAQDYPQIALNAMRTMGGRLKDTHARLRELQTERVERRIAHAIARLVAQAGRRVEGGILIDFPVRSEERRGGKEWVSTGRFRGAP